MSVYWDKRNKRWRFSFNRVIEGRRHRANRLLPEGWSQAQADAFDRKESARLYAVATGIQRDEPLIDLAVKLYLTDKQHLKSIKGATENLAAIAWAYMGKPMSELPAVARLVTENRVVPAVDGGRGEHTLTMTTARNRLALLKAAARWAWKRHGLVDADPAARMQLPPAAPGRKVYIERKGALQAARAATHHQTCVAIRVAFYTGFRLGELYRVRVEGQRLVLEDSKNGEPRIVPVHPRILRCLPYLPLTISRNTLRADWVRARGATVGHGVRFHDIRHSTASALINAGVDLYTVGGVLGHKDTRSTARYSHLQTSTLAAAVGKIGRKPAHNDQEEGHPKVA